MKMVVIESCLAYARRWMNTPTSTVPVPGYTCMLTYVIRGCDTMIQNSTGTRHTTRKYRMSSLSHMTYVILRVEHMDMFIVALTGVSICMTHDIELYAMSICI